MRAHDLERYRQRPWTVACLILAIITALGLWPNQILWRFAVQALVNVLLFDWAADFALTVLEPNGAVPAATSRRLILIAMLSALWEIGRASCRERVCMSVVA